MTKFIFSYETNPQSGAVLGLCTRSPQHQGDYTDCTVTDGEMEKGQSGVAVAFALLAGLCGLLATVGSALLPTTSLLSVVFNLKRAFSKLFAPSNTQTAPTGSITSLTGIRLVAMVVFMGLSINGT